jgi:hypothetical protein
MANLEHISGRVTAVGDKRPPGGVKIEGYDQWFNLSKYEKNLVLPNRGDVVDLGVGQDGFVREITWTERAAPPSGSGPTPGTPGLIALPAGPIELSAEQIRIEALKIAAMFCGTRQEATTDHVVILAKTWERFIVSGEVPTHSATPARNGQAPATPPTPSSDMAPA